MASSIATPRTEPTYVLGHSSSELQRLIDQSSMFGEDTERLLIEAGIRPRMRVLDVGTGPGDVALIAGRLVGPRGAVLGIDRSRDAIAAARGRAAAAGLHHVHFEVSDLNDLDVEEPVDAVVGRFVLMYQGEPHLTLRDLAALVRPGGVLAFHEMDLTTGLDSFPRCELWDRSVTMLRETFWTAGTELRMGLRLHEVFVRAGLPAPKLRLAGRIETGPESPAYTLLANVIRSAMPMIERYGYGTAAEIGIDTLAARLRHEVTSANAVVMSPLTVSAWAVKGGA